tara:strand:- start:12347 stop:12889 length:543 start_codon:yes stop_codon:yes gene_type:complete
MKARLLLPLVLIALVGCSSVPLPKKEAKGNETFAFYNPDVAKLPEFAGKSVEAMKTIQDELRAQLTAAGLTEVKDITEKPDLIVAYLLVLQNNTVTTAVRDYYVSSGVEIIEAAHEYSQDHKPHRKFQSGTVVVDVIDVKTEKLIYRDYATREVKKGLTSEQRQKLVRKATDEAIQQFLD